MKNNPDSPFAQDRAVTVVNTILGAIEDVIKTAIEDALSTPEMRCFLTNILRDEFADLTRQVIAENRPID